MLYNVVLSVHAVEMAHNCIEKNRHGSHVQCLGMGIWECVEPGPDLMTRLCPGMREERLLSEVTSTRAVVVF